MKVLVTGGTGYIASHTVVLFAEAGHVPILLDNFSNSSPLVLKRIETLTGKAMECHNVNLEDQKSLEAVFARHVNLKSGRCEIGAVVHFGARKCVSESLRMPLEYYQTNILGTLNILRAMHEFGVNTLIFSSSAAVYGSTQITNCNSTSCIDNASSADSSTLKEDLFSEDAPLNPTNPYAVSKVACERIIEDCARAYNLRTLSLRYFNPIGAHPSGLLGEDPRALNNLFPILAHAAYHSQPLVVHGFDYPTLDGTTIRDYLHVMDVANGHLKALEYITTTMTNGSSNGFNEVVNLGSGRGTSVLEALRMFTKTTGANVPFRLGPRRPGDVPSLVAKVDKALRLLNWQPQYSLEDACRDLWKWQQQQRPPQ